ncbi:MAG: AbrB/MazE/SpoVT family DNA-binding domain-containing protein [Dehalococcoidales bacterium]|nr:AbrB/MazE/SpoVT family DNA-binding domain-containing protein [Dehalococcoidales bacterium]
MKTIINESGRLVIPASFRKALGLKPGDEVLLILQDDEIRIISARQAIKRSQSLVRSYIRAGRSLSEELIRERREEVDNG